MAQDVQTISFVGRLGREPEGKFDQNGAAITNFSVACNNRDDTTTWYRVTAFGKLGEICNQYLTKGKQVFISGDFNIRTYTDKEGNERTSYDVRATSMQMLGSKSDNAGENTQTARSTSQQPAQQATVQRNKPVAVRADDEESLPF